MKRLFDVVCAVTGLVILGPIILLTAWLIRWNIGSPVFFKQDRPGLNGVPFILYKFRTMTNECDEYGKLLPDHKRLTPFGKLVRKLSLDELPQLYNVLKGEMSLVGPRPLLMEYLPLYTERQAMRHLVRPGITGLAQVSGRNAISWDERLEMDAQYVESRSWILDLKILLLTISKVFKSEGINQKGHATVEKFAGSKSIGGDHQ
ncbi:sugar transferase [Ammoniphilus oxalaticus]|uniref:Sugar transferase n=1 Tax=Ammoniphilus oxalaticus TaxID=66863 RepID=A0A419SHB9_9BACL|nr:sugar transferase [Ammoniphilus oxalaticus]RKD23178.1 sugar transferase [Ammoniphilus oxalaticus]